MKTAWRQGVGLGLVALGVVYLIGRAPRGPGWLWGVLGGALFLCLAGCGAPAAAAALGASLLGWALGAFAADHTGLESLKLVGTGLGLGLWGWLERREAATWGGGALLAAGALVFLWESPGGSILALLLLALGAYLLLRPGAYPSAAPVRADAPGEQVYRALVGWRNRRAAELGVLNTGLLSDAELGCIAALQNPADPGEIADCLENGGAERAAEIAGVLGSLRE